MAAPAAGFDASLQPGWTAGSNTESNNTTSLKKNKVAKKLA